MNKTTEALRIEIEDLKNSQYELTEKMKRESKRTDRVVQVLLNTLPEEQLNSKVTFLGIDCCGEFRDWYGGDGHTLNEFLNEVIDP